MAMTLVCDSADRMHELCFKVLVSWRERLVGLLGTDAGADPVTLSPCWSVHTFFMRYAIDVAFVARDGRVVASRRCVPPGRLLAGPGACWARERPARRGWWPQKGLVLRLTTREGEG